MSMFKQAWTKLKRLGKQVPLTKDNWKTWCYVQAKRGFNQQEIETQLIQDGFQNELNNNRTYLENLFKNNTPMTWKRFIGTKDEWKENFYVVLNFIIFVLLIILPLSGIVYLISWIVYILVNYTGYVVFAFFAIVGGIGMSSRSLAWLGACTLGLFSLFNRYDD